VTVLVDEKVHSILRAAARAGTPTVECSLDLDRSRTTVEVALQSGPWQGERFPYLETCKDRTVYHWVGEAFQPVSRFTTVADQAGADRMGPADVRNRRHQDAAHGHASRPLRPTPNAKWD